MNIQTKATGLNPKQTSTAPSFESKKSVDNIDSLKQAALVEPKSIEQPSAQKEPSS